MADSKLINANARGKTLRYRVPAGSWITLTHDLDLDHVRKMVLREEPAAWKVGSGDATLTFRSAEREAALGIMYKSSHGFMLTHNFTRDLVERGDMHVSLSVRPFRKRTSLFSGGDFFLFWEAFFITADDAWMAVDDFMRSGGRSDRIRWIRHQDAPAAPDSQIHGKPY